MLPDLSSYPVSASPTQLVLVLGDDWDSSAATLRCFDLASPGQAWQPGPGPFRAVLGRAGMAVGSGFPDAGPGEARRKREGDGRSPAGVFPITGLFGYGAADEGVAPVARLPFLAATPNLKCVDDPASRHYNRIVDRRRVDEDWRSCEDMLRGDCRYEIGAVVGYNCEPVVPGAGSCIFLHVWEAPGVPTAGCTALARDDMLALATWLDGARAPVLVQLPRAVCEALREPWRLPGLTEN